MNNILVTGATGFVGSHLVEELVKSKANIIATTHHKILPHSYFATQKLHNKSKVVKIDLADFTDTRKLVTNNNPNYIFHLAAQPLVEEAFENPRTTLYTNILGTINILECARLSKNIKAVIIASSDKAYGKLNLELRTKNLEQKNDKFLSEAGCNFRRLYTECLCQDIHQEFSNKIPTQRRDDNAVSESSHLAVKKIASASLKYTETDPLRGDHPYEVSKSSADLISQTYFKTYGLPVVITRFGNIYGEGDIHFSRLIPGVMKALVNNEVFKIRSNGKYIRDYLYVKDVVRGYLMLANNIDKVKGEAFNFGSNDTYSVLSLISLISQICQIRIRYRILNSARNEIPYQSLDWSKIRKTLGWKPQYSLKKTVKRVFQWYEGG